MLVLLLNSGYSLYPVRSGVDKLVLKSRFGSTVICNHSALLADFWKWKNYLCLMVMKQLSILMMY